MQSARTFVGVALPFIVVFVSACSLFTSLDGLTTPVTESPLDESDAAEPSQADATTADAANETGASDADAPSWCATHRGDAGFCEDFDESEVLPFGSIVETHGKIRRDDITSSSPRFSLAASADALVDAGQVETYVGYTAPKVDAVIAEVTVDVRLDLATDGTFSDQQFLKVNVAKDGKQWQVGVGAAGSAKRLFVFQYDVTANKYSQPFTPATSVPIGQWFTLGLKLTITEAGKAVVDTTFNGAPWASSVALTPPMANGQMTGMFGITYAPGGTHPAFANHVDNVVFDVR
ncbi:hypothetical protein AKJ09_07572 [Labilithrix luteola]|uniref:Uncharacterized protein n=1 Tax=Labilithrix luteola TaxID=1391654 RepID=A0A0K1Q5B2_9BACT|nr:hypothetical protein [Labilithrix luteola]AKV00909.1 hypothetical protein AKJ09_07572 [Labilithrix luteola]